ELLSLLGLPDDAAVRVVADYYSADPMTLKTSTRRWLGDLARIRSGMVYLGRRVGFNPQVRELVAEHWWEIAPTNHPRADTVAAGPAPRPSALQVRDPGTGALVPRDLPGYGYDTFE